MVPPKEKANIIAKLKAEDEEEDLEYLGTFLPDLETEKEQLYQDDKGDENDASGQYLGPTLMDKEYTDAMAAWEVIPPNYDAYAEGNHDQNSLHLPQFYLDKFFMKQQGIA